MRSVRGLKLSIRIFIMIALLILLPFTVMLQYVKIDMEALLRDEISLKIVQNLSKSENEISQIFSRMVAISNIFYSDPEIAKIFSDDSYSYYDRMVAFDNVINQISMQNLYDNIFNHLKITFFDKKNRAYANWSLNYNDYTYLLEQEWVQQSMAARGYIIWSMSSKGYGEKNGNEKPNHISIARSIMNNDHSGNTLGTILIGINQQQICDILDTYKYSELDSIFASTQEGEVLFRNNDIISEEEQYRLVREHEHEQKGNTMLKVGNRRYLLSFYTIKLISMYSRKQLKIFYLTDYQYLDNQIKGLLIKINTMCVLFITVVFLVALAIAARIAKPIKVLSNQMKNYRVGEEPIPLARGRKDEIGEIYSAFYNMSLYINDLFSKLKQEQVTKEKYQYESLRSKISPHFLFNTLNSIRWMAIIRKADNIRESIDSLTEILKYSLTEDEEMVELAREIEVIRKYCYIQNMRFGNSYSLKVDLAPDIERCQIIKFILQPAVENVFKHAYPAGSSGGVITICGYIENGHLFISVSDNGKGFPEEVILRFNNKKAGKAIESRKSGIGLDIIDERIRVSLGDGYGIELSNNVDGGARVDYRLPVIQREIGKEETAG